MRLCTLLKQAPVVLALALYKPPSKNTQILFVICESVMLAVHHLALEVSVCGQYNS